MNHSIADALADVEQWHQASIKAGAAARLLMAAAKQAGIKEVQLAQMLEITIPKMQWLARRGLGPVNQLQTSVLVSE